MKKRVVLSITGGVLFLLMTACSALEQDPLPTLVPVIQLPEPTATSLPENGGQTIEIPPESATAVPSQVTPTAVETIPTVPPSIDNHGALLYVNSAGEGLFLARPDSAAQTQYYALQNIAKLLPASFNGQRIGFIREGKFFIARTDGAGIMEITAVSPPSWLIWSPTSDEFVVIDNGDLVVLQADSGAASRVATGMQLTNIPGSVAWSPDGQHLLFTCGAQATDLCRVASNGSEAMVNITNNGADSFAWYREPAWSPDGNQISYISPDADKNLQLFVMNADGGGVRQLTVGSGQSSLHKWSPDGQRIAYANFADGAWQAMVVNIDGTNQVELSATLPPLSAVVPQWDTTGTQVSLLYTTDASVDSVSIALVSVAETAVTPITDNGWQLQWSPEGRQVAYIAADGQIYIQVSSGAGSPFVISCQGGCDSFTWLP